MQVQTEAEDSRAAQEPGPDFSKVPEARVVYLIGGELHAWTVPQPPSALNSREYDPYE
jgi:hypothetical protein